MPNEAISRHLQTMKQKPPQPHGELTIIPLVGPNTNMSVVSLSTAMRLHQVKVREVSERGRVPELVVENRGHRPVFILDGEEVVGGKQSRVVNSSILCAAGEDTVIPVSCCESGRWRRGSRRGFVSRNRSMPSGLKAAKVMRVSRNLRSWGNHDANQSQVWRDLDEFSTLRRVRSPTSAMGDVFEADADVVRDIVENIRPQPHQVGVAAFHGSRLIAVEIFGTSSLYEQEHPTLMHSFATDVLMHRAREDREAVVTPIVSPLEFASRVLRGRMTTHDTAGLGRDVRVSGSNGHSTALVHDGDVVHLSMFRARG